MIVGGLTHNDSSNLLDVQMLLPGLTRMAAGAESGSGKREQKAGAES
jgi:hypothetical protein